MPAPPARARRSSRAAIGVSLAVHAVGAVLVAFYIATNVIAERVEEDFAVEWVVIPEMRLRRLSPRKVVARRTTQPLAEVVDTPPDTSSPDMIPEVVTRTMELVARTSTSIQEPPPRRPLRRASRPVGVSKPRASELREGSPAARASAYSTPREPPRPTSRM